jgi:hypothetical protein
LCSCRFVGLQALCDVNVVPVSVARRLLIRWPWLASSRTQPIARVSRRQIQRTVPTSLWWVVLAGTDRTVPGQSMTPAVVYQEEEQPGAEVERSGAEEIEQVQTGHRPGQVLGGERRGKGQERAERAADRRRQVVVCSDDEQRGQRRAHQYWNQPVGAPEATGPAGRARGSRRDAAPITKLRRPRRRAATIRAAGRITMGMILTLSAAAKHAPDHPGRPRSARSHALSRLSITNTGSVLRPS